MVLKQTAQSLCLYNHGLETYPEFSQSKSMYSSIPIMPEFPKSFNKKLTINNVLMPITMLFSITTLIWKQSTLVFQ